MEIINYAESYFESLIDFLIANWSPKHAIYDHEIFRWQYRIDDENDSESLLLMENNQIIGFLGIIPSKVIVKGASLAGGALTMWVVDKKYRNSGLGILLIKEAERRYSATYTLGCNLTVAPMYQRMGYSYSDNLQRYILPINSEKYKHLLSCSPESLNKDIFWDEKSEQNEQALSPNENTDTHHLERLYQQSIVPYFSFSQNRDADFWSWRYMNSAGYKYYFFGEPQKAGIAVVRIDSVYSLEQKNTHGMKVLRFIELIPTEGSVWNGKHDDAFLHMIQGVLLWAREQGCVAADYQCSSNRLEHILFRVGFCKQFRDFTPDAYSLAGLFQPLRYKVNPINFTWKINKDNSIVDVRVDDTYFVKSDADMDRPNIWPLPEGWNI